MRLILVRNAEHIGEVEKIWAEKIVGLTENGKRQAKLLCDCLKRERPIAIYSSDELRTIETVKPLAETLRLEIALNAGFRSIDVGKFLGQSMAGTADILGEKTWHEIMTNPNPQKRYFDGGETLEEETERVWKSLNTILKQYTPEDTIIISTHLIAIGSIFCKLLNIPLNNVWFWGGTLASITTVVFHNNKWYLQHYGCAEHLTKT